MFMTLGLGTSDNPHTIANYIKYGATEFFIGYVPQTWLDKYGWEVCPNRRTMGPAYNFSQISELREIVKGVHDNGGTVNFAVNAHDNGADRMDQIKEMFDLFEPLNPDGYIIADPAVMYCMKDWGIKRDIHLSTGLGCFNSEAVRFFCEQFDISRLVIPRKLTLGEMKQMMDALKDLNLEYEVMIIGYRCYFNDEDCHSVHSGARRNLCGDVVSSTFISSNRLPANWKDAIEEMNKGGAAASLKEGSVLDKVRKEWVKTVPPVFKPVQYAYCESGVDGELVHAMFQTCGLCAIKKLREMGVQVLKVPFRGDEDTKLEAVKLVHDVMTAEDPNPEFCKKLLNSPSFCSQPVSCYYEVPEE